MTLLVPQTGAIPRPKPSSLSQPFWDGLGLHELRFQRCGACRGATHTPALVCSRCGSDELTWEVSTGRGIVYSWTTVWRPQTPEFVVPYVPIVVDVEEGWQMLSNLVGCDHDEVAPDLAVEVVFHHLDDGVTLPYFRPIGG
ncbi:MAG: hypothetical protein JWL73_1114 [Actinomycetia bacterium]|nr:hypothetical protein [Actinomycetes bacterium]